MRTMTSGALVRQETREKKKPVSRALAAKQTKSISFECSKQLIIAAEVKCAVALHQSAKR